jgi:hypothetical protein
MDDQRMKLNTKTVIGSVAIGCLTIVAAIGFTAGGPDPTGTGYVYTVNGVTNPSSLSGSNCMLAAFCDGGLPCAVVNPYCDAGGQ